MRARIGGRPSCSRSAIFLSQPVSTKPLFNAAAGLSSPRGAASIRNRCQRACGALCFCFDTRWHMGCARISSLYGFYDFQLTVPASTFFFTTSDLIGNDNAMLYYVGLPLYARGFYTLSRHDAIVGFAAMRVRIPCLPIAAP